MKRLAWTAGIALAAALAAGAASFPYTLEPGRSEANGITLNLVVDRAAHGERNDWYTGQAGVSVARRGRGLALEGAVRGFVLVSRPLPVFGGRRYIARVRAVSRDSRRVGVAIVGENLTRSYVAKYLPSGAAATLELPFELPDAARVSILIWAPAHVGLRLFSARLAPAAR